MMKLYGVIGNKSELVIISDRCIVIKRAIPKIFRTTIHGFCFYHVIGNKKSKFRMSKVVWDEFEHAFINAAKVYGHKKF